MKKYIYGAVLVAVVTAGAIFFFRPPEITNRLPQTTVAITFRFPEGYEFTENAPFVLTWRAESPEGTFSVPTPDKDFNPLVSPYKLFMTPPLGSAAVILNARLYYCHKTSRMCFQGDFETRVPLVEGRSSNSSGTLAGLGGPVVAGRDFNSSGTLAGLGGPVVAGDTAPISCVWEIIPKET